MYKKILSISILSLCTLWLMWCSTKKNQQSTTTDTSSCKVAIASYLEQSKTSSNGQIVAKWNTVTVDYVGRLDAETVFDTSVENIAQACGKYASGRNYNEGLSFSVGAWQMIGGFDKGVEGMKVGETKTIEIAPKDAYGERDKNKLLVVTKDKIPDANQYKVGMQVMSQNGQTFKVYKVDDKEITFDANHELAGKTLIFDITIKSVK